jgi:hypothetical protein
MIQLARHTGSVHFHETIAKAAQPASRKPKLSANIDSTL